MWSKYRFVIFVTGLYVEGGCVLQQNLISILSEIVIFITWPVGIFFYKPLSSSKGRPPNHKGGLGLSTADALPSSVQTTVLTAVIFTAVRYPSVSTLDLIRLRNGGGARKKCLSALCGCAFRLLS